MKILGYKYIETIKFRPLKKDWWLMIEQTGWIGYMKLFRLSVIRMFGFNFMKYIPNQQSGKKINEWKQ